MAAPLERRITQISIVLIASTGVSAKGVSEGKVEKINRERRRQEIFGDANGSYEVDNMSL
jgi:hypothetical protein